MIKDDKRWDSGDSGMINHGMIKDDKPKHFGLHPWLIPMINHDNKP